MLHDDAPTNSPTRAPLEQLLTTEQAAQMLAVSPTTMATWRVKGGGPPYHKFGRRTVRYAPSDLTVWVADRLRSNTTQDSVLRQRRAL